MPYKSISTRALVKEFDKLPKNVKERVLETLRKVAGLPTPEPSYGESLRDAWVEVGKCRIILVNEGEKAIAFLDAGLGKTIYE